MICQSKTVQLVKFRPLMGVHSGELGIEMEGRNTLVCVILWSNIRIEIKWERSPVRIDQFFICRKRILKLSIPRIRKIFMTGNGSAWRFSRTRTTDEGVDSCSPSAAWSTSESMARLMVLAIEASDENVEDTQRRDFSQGCAWRLVEALSLAARSELPRKWQILARLVRLPVPVDDYEADSA
jgi:hypothetical protein